MILLLRQSVCVRTRGGQVVHEPFAFLIHHHVVHEPFAFHLQPHNEDM